MKKSSAMYLLVIFAFFNTSFAQIERTDTISEVVIESQKSGSTFDTKGTNLSQLMNQQEFKKAACCTLSESFETNNSVEISNSDGVSGVKQIELLGLSGRYVSLTHENISQLSGLNQLNGLSNIPGPFVSELRISKGIGSVVNGIDGIIGAIDYTFKKSTMEPKIQLNIYRNQQKRTEYNLYSQLSNRRKFKSWIYLHNGFQNNFTDNNHDGFSDLPNYNRLFLAQHSEIQYKKTNFQLGYLFWKDQKEAKQLSEVINPQNNSLYLFNQTEYHSDIYAKVGTILNELNNKSIGNILNASIHQLNSLLSNKINRNYTGNELRLSYMLLYQQDITKKINFKSGAHYQFNFRKEQLYDVFTSISPKIVQNQLGIFLESNIILGKINAVFGLRNDYNSVYGNMFIPRMHLKYEKNKNLKFFYQAGLGYRIPYILSENLSNLVNNRMIIGLNSGNTQLPMNLMMEKAVNTGFSALKNFMFLDFPSSLSFDVFYTQFLSQISIDRDINLSTILIQNASKPGFSKSLHIEWISHPIRRMEIKTAYRFIDQQMWLNNSFRSNPFQSKHRFLFTLNYKTRNLWYFDGIVQINGPKRLPYFDKMSPWYSMINLQIRKQWKKHFEWYVGVENIANMMQKDAILYMVNGVSEIYDGNFSWGPSAGRIIYSGLRVTLF